MIHGVSFYKTTIKQEGIIMSKPKDGRSNVIVIRGPESVRGSMERLEEELCSCCGNSKLEFEITTYPNTPANTWAHHSPPEIESPWGFYCGLGGIESFKRKLSHLFPREDKK